MDKDTILRHRLRAARAASLGDAAWVPGPIKRHARMRAISSVAPSCGLMTCI